MSTVRRLLRYILAWIGLLVASGCAATSPSTSVTSTDTRERGRNQPTAHRLRMAVEPWLGTPYRLGGTTTDGVDCSAFVATIYEEVFGQHLPRTTEEQVQRGRPVRRSALKPGDLIFFKPRRGQDHVGIYLKDRRFAHASTSEGVTVSSITTPYWKRAFWTARRLRPIDTASTSRNDATPPDPTSDDEEKRAPAATGW